MKPHEIENLIPNLRPFFKAREPIRLAYLFGSTVREAKFRDWERYRKTCGLETLKKDRDMQNMVLLSSWRVTGTSSRYGEAPPAVGRLPQRGCARLLAFSPRPCPRDTEDQAHGDEQFVSDVRTLL